MTENFFSPASPFLDKKRKNNIPVTFIRSGNFSAWLKKQDERTKNLVKETGHQGNPGSVLVLRNTKGKLDRLVIGMRNPCSVCDPGSAVQALRQNLSRDFLRTCSFTLEGETLDRKELENACTGWGLACYEFNTYKNSGTEFPALLWPKNVNKKRIISTVESILMLRNLVNTPSNDMGPDEIEETARHLSKKFRTKLEVIKGEKLQKGFPLVHAVGHGSERRPRLIDMVWGNPKNPKVTLVGKGVCFDTGGLNIKPTSAMALMKKDMGGAAHVLALAQMVMAQDLPVRLRVLIPAVENSVSGGSFRPGDIFKSRKGLTIENTNTDAEGRLILADALTYACEENPEMIIDFATLTGSARAALGPDIPPFFSNDNSIAETIKNISFSNDDPVWPMPLWKPYKKLIESPAANLVNSTGIPGDLAFSALFLEQFLTGKPKWIHLDVYAWEHTGKPGRPKGGADNGLRTIFSFLEERYAGKKNSRTGSKRR